MGVGHGRVVGCGPGELCGHVLVYVAASAKPFDVERFAVIMMVRMDIMFGSTALAGAADQTAALQRFLNSMVRASLFWVGLAPSNKIRAKRVLFGLTAGCSLPPCEIIRSHYD